MTVLGLVKRFIRTGMFGDLILIILLVFVMAVIVAMLMAADPSTRPYTNGFKNRLKRAFGGRPTKPHFIMRLRSSTSRRPKKVPIECDKAYCARPMKTTLLKADGTPMAETREARQGCLKEAYYGRTTPPAMALEKEKVDAKTLEQQSQAVKKVYYGRRQMKPDARPLPVVKRLDD